MTTGALTAQTRLLQVSALVLAGAILLSATGQGISLTVAPLEIARSGFAQSVAVHNNYLRTLRFVEIGCDFFAGGRLVDGTTFFIRDVRAFGSGEALVTGRRDRPADRAVCRILGSG